MITITKKKFLDIVSAIFFTKTIIGITLAFTEYTVLCVPLITCGFMILLLGITVEDNEHVFDKDIILPVYQKKVPLYAKVKTP